MLVYRFPRISSLLRQRGADWVAAIFGAVLAAVLLPLTSAVHGRGGVGVPALALLVVWAGSLGFLGVRTWRRLWRTGRTAAEKMIYDRGVRGFGAILLLSVPAVVGMAVALAERPNTSGWWLLLLSCELISLLTALPVCLWAGYVFGTLMIGALPHLKSEREPDDLPPVA